MAVFLVTTTDDELDVVPSEGAGLSLREALVLANNTPGADEITFDPALIGSTIYLSRLAQLEITSDVTIDGDIDNDGAGDITVNANSAAGANNAISRVLAITSGSTAIDGLTITGGSDLYGAGIRISAGASASLTNSMISGNYASVYGGGIYSDGGTLTLANSTVADNSAGVSGGGIYASNGSMTMLTNSTVSGNSAVLDGGGIYGGNGSTTALNNSTVDGNNASRYGGGIYSTSTLTLANSTISGNGALVNGGGLSGTGPATLTNSTISGNFAAANGGGIEKFSGTLTLINSTISGNSAGVAGGGIYGEVDSTVTLTNSIVLGNTAPSSSDSGGPGAFTNNLSIVGGLDPANVFAALAGNGGGLLADNGGPVQTIALNADGANPALDAGDDNAAGVPLTDARGLARSDVPGVANNGANISDLGAYELRVNNPPVAVDDSATIDEDSSANIAVLANDTDIDGDTLTAAISGNPANGSVEIVNNIAIYTPVMNFNGTDSFTYSVSDGNGGSDIGTVTITVNPVNDAPVAADDNAAVDEDGSVTINVLANDSDIDGGGLVVNVVSGPASGTANVVAGGISYVPDTNFNGTDSFTYSVSDGNGGSDIGTVTITVNPVNDPPVAADDAVSAIAGQANNYGAAVLLANDSDLDGDTLTITAVGGGVNGSASLNGTTVTFTPDIGFSGPASFTYTVGDGNGGSDTATVSVAVSAGNAPPNAVDDIVSVDEDSSVAISVLANDSDPDGDAISVTGNTAPANGSLTDNGLGNFTYTPGADFNGSDSFTYSVSDGNGGTDTATVTITVNAVNDAPVAADDTANVDEDGSVTINVLANDSDVDGDALTVTGVSSPASGTASVGAGGITYTPGADFNGSDSFTYTVGDGNGGTDTATVSVTVNPVNDNPLAADDAVTATIDESSNYAAATLLANDSDVDGDTLTVTTVGGGVNGSASLNGTSVTFTPDAGFTGAASFTYTVSDGNGGSDSATVNVTVTDGNLPPVADAARSVTTLTGTALVFDIAASDPDGDALSFSASTPASGAVSLVGGRVTYTPATGFTGSETITVTIDDGNGGTATQDVTITTQNLPAANQFVMFTANGFAGGAGGSGAINGTDAFQQIAVIDVPGAISLDPSFNKGGDILQLSGDASAWNITRSGSSALFSDGDTFITVPVGTAGLAVLFDDGVRSLKFDGSSFAIGGQAFASGTLSPITAAPDGTSLPTGADPAAKAVLFIAADAGIAASGVVDIFGAAGDELARLISGNLTLDASFNRGGDTIAFDEAATDYSASQSGSLLRLTGSDTTALIPVGTSGATLAFGDGSDTRTLLLDTTIPAITIAGQQIGPDPVQLMAI